MDTIQEFVLTAKRLCQTIDKAIEQENRFCEEVSSKLELLNWDIFRICEDLNQINQFLDEDSHESFKEAC